MQAEIQKQNTAAVMEARTKYMGIKQHLLDNQETGLVTQRGKDAIINGAGYNDQLSDAVKKLRQDLGNDDQRAAFDVIDAREKIIFRSDVDRHVRREGDTYHRNTFTAATELSQEEAVGAARRGDLVAGPDRAIGMAHGAIDIEAERLGWGKKEVEARKMKVSTNARLGVIDVLLDQGLNSDAGFYLANYRGEISADVLAKLNVEARIGAGIKKQSRSQIANGLYDDAGGDRGAALLEVDRMLDDEIIGDKDYDALVRGVNRRADRDDKLRDEHEEGLLGRVREMLSLDAGPGDFEDDDPIMMEFWTDEGRGAALKLRDGERRAARGATINDLRNQREIELAELRGVKALVRFGEEGLDLRTADLDKLMPSSRKLNRDLAVALQNDAQVEYDKNQGVDYRTARAMAEPFLGKQKGKGKRTKEEQFESDFRTRVQRMKAEGKTSPITTDEVDTWLTNQFLVGEQGPADYMFYPTDLTRNEARAKDQSFANPVTGRVEPPPSEETLIREMIKSDPDLLNEMHRVHGDPQRPGVVNQAMVDELYRRSGKGE